MASEPSGIILVRDTSPTIFAPGICPPDSRFVSWPILISIPAPAFDILQVRQNVRMQPGQWCFLHNNKNPREALLLRYYKEFQVCRCQRQRFVCIITDGAIAYSRKHHRHSQFQLRRKRTVYSSVCKPMYLLWFFPR